MNICVYGINSLSLHSKRNIYRSLVTTAFLFNYPDHPFREKGMAFCFMANSELSLFHHIHAYVVAKKHCVIDIGQ